MTPTTTLLVYSLLIIAASLFGGVIPMIVRLTHRRMELILSFVSGVMLGVGVLHLLPHAIVLRQDEPGGGGHGGLEPLLLWMLGGFLLIFLLERFFCFHHHDAPGDEGGDGHACGHDHGSDSADGHQLTWAGAAVGLTIHSVLAGAALAAATFAVAGEHDHAADGHVELTLAGFATFLMIILHKPFDSLTIGALMARGAWSKGMRMLINGLFAAAVPLGVVLFAIGVDLVGDSTVLIANALAFSAGVFLCIALSDVLPELQFHSHDRVKLSLALILGIAVAWGVAKLEPHEHEEHDDEPHVEEVADVRSMLDPSGPMGTLDLTMLHTTTIAIDSITKPR